MTAFFADRHGDELISTDDLAGEIGLDHAPEDRELPSGKANEPTTEAGLVLESIDELGLEIEAELEIFERQYEANGKPFSGLPPGQCREHAEPTDRPIIDRIALTVDLDRDRNAQSDVLTMDLGFLFDLHRHGTSARSGRRATVRTATSIARLRRLRP